LEAGALRRFRRSEPGGQRVSEPQLLGTAVKADVDRPTAVSAKGAVKDHLLQRALDYGDLVVVQFRHEKLGDRA
jgi:hypothetical protein